MRVISTPISGAFLVEPERLEDSRGFFARSWCSRTFAAQGLASQFVQTNISYNRREGTLRGLHYQAAPHQENKLIRCTKGSIYDVIVDLRAHSSSYGDWFSIILTSANHRQLYIPGGCAHGYQTLSDDCEILYMVSDYYCPECERGICHDDPGLAIVWPRPPKDISEKDRSWPNFDFKWTAQPAKTIAGFSSGNCQPPKHAPQTLNRQRQRS
jgi:dTDP-4-dehydrorhamnose 3,5-epimerase